MRRAVTFIDMTRPSRQLDKKMIAAGVDIINKYGLESLSINNVCKLAGVNNGMFNYCFSKKDQFIIEIIQNIIAEFGNKIKNIKEDTIENMFKSYVNIIYTTMTTNLSLIQTLTVGIMSQYENIAEQVLQIIEDNKDAWFIIQKCQDAGYITSKFPALEIFSMLLRIFVPSIALYRYSCEQKCQIQKMQLDIMVNSLLCKQEYKEGL